MSPTLSLYEKGWRDGFWGREPTSADSTYMEGWAVGVRRGDRTSPPAPIPADLTGSAHQSPRVEASKLHAGALPEET